MAKETDPKNPPAISLLHRRKPAPPTLAADHLRNYWTQLSAGHILPARRDIDPRALGPVLEHCFVLERIAPGVARFRLAGRHLGELMGLEVRGMPLTTFFEPGARKEVADAVEACCATPATCTLSLRASPGIGRSALRGTMILLPLADDMGRTTRILGSLESTGTPGRLPRRFTISHVRSDPQYLGAGMPKAPAPLPAFAESPTPFRHRQGSDSGTDTGAENAAPARPAPRPALKLVIDNG